MQKLWLSWLAMPFVILLSLGATCPNSPERCIGITDPRELAICLASTPTPRPAVDPSPSATVPAEATPTSTSSPEPTASPSPSPAPGNPPGIPDCSPPMLKGINGGGGCKWTKRAGDTITCELDFTQIFHGNDGQDGPCDPDHYCKKGFAYNPATKTCAEGQIAMGDECSFREHDEKRIINRGGFVLAVGGAEILDNGLTSHQARIRGPIGSPIVVYICPNVDLKSGDGCRISVRGEKPFDRRGCGEQKWSLVEKTPKPVR